METMRLSVSPKKKSEELLRFFREDGMGGHDTEKYYLEYLSECFTRDDEAKT